MPLIEWTDGMSVGVAAFDDDHKKLVAMLNELFDSMQSGAGKDKLGEILDGLIAYTVTHFDREEKMFAEHGFPGAEAHIKQHEDLKAQAVAAQEKFKSGAAATVSMEVLNFLKNWLVTHIQGSDMAYSAFFKQKGLAA